ETVLKSPTHISARRARRLDGGRESSVGVDTDHLPVRSATENLPGYQVDRLLDEPDGAVLHQDVCTAGVERIELIGTTQRTVGEWITSGPRRVMARCSMPEWHRDRRN